MTPYTIPVTDVDKFGILEAMARQRSREIDLVEQLFNKEEMFRFSYVPFVVAALVWDYADTVIDIAKQQRIKEARNVTRQIIKLKEEYDALRAPYVDREHQASEVENMEVAEEQFAEVMKPYNAAIARELRATYPTLSGNRLYFLIAVYQCLVTLRGLIRFVQRQRRSTEKRIGMQVGDILPRQLYSLGFNLKLLIDRPVSISFEMREETYVNAIATQMELIEMNDVTDDTVLQEP